MVKIQVFICNLFQERCYLVWGDSRDAVIIDPGCEDNEAEDLFSFISDQNLNVRAVLLTHGHFDHIYGVKSVSEHYGVPVYLHPDDQVILDHSEAMASRMNMPTPDSSWPYIPIREGSEIAFSDLKFEVLETPGHSPGSVCLLLRREGHVFCGDCLFAGSIGMTSYEWGDYDKEISSIMNKLMHLDFETVVHPGHGPETTIGTEFSTNPFLEPFNFKDPETGKVEGFDD